MIKHTGYDTIVQNIHVQTRRTVALLYKMYLLVRLALIATLI